MRKAIIDDVISIVFLQDIDLGFPAGFFNAAILCSECKTMSPILSHVHENACVCTRRARIEGTWHCQDCREAEDHMLRRKWLSTMSSMIELFEYEQCHSKSVNLLEISELARCVWCKGKIPAQRFASTYVLPYLKLLQDNCDQMTFEARSEQHRPTISSM